MSKKSPQFLRSVSVTLSTILAVSFLAGCAKPAPPPPTGKWGYINKAGIFIIQPQFDEASEFTDAGAIVRDGKRLLRLKANPPGESSDPVKPDDTASLSPLPTLKAAEAGPDTYKILDGEKVVFDAETVPASDAVFHGGDLVCVRFGDQYAFINKDGKLGIPQPYKAARNFNDKRAPVMDGGKWGYINEKGMAKIPAKFLDAGAFNNGLAPVKIPSDAPAKGGLF